MKKILLLLPLVGLASLLSSCMVDQYGNVIPAGPVYAGGPGYYGPYGDPFFVYGGLSYYNYNGRYCYYRHGHRIFVSNLPSGGHYYHGGGSHYVKPFNGGSVSPYHYRTSQIQYHTNQYRTTGLNTRGISNTGGPRFSTTQGHVSNAVVPGGKGKQTSNGGGQSKGKDKY